MWPQATKNIMSLDFPTFIIHIGFQDMCEYTHEWSYEYNYVTDKIAYFPDYNT